VSGSGAPAKGMLGVAVFDAGSSYVGLDGFIFFG
jgi:hypothetical protein